MKESEILKVRLYHTGLIASPFRSAAQAISHLGAMQAQDFAAAKWALGLRVPGATDKTIEAAFNTGEILRTHVMRPTWHFLLPEDIRWMLELTAPNIKRRLAPYNRKLNLDADLFAKSKRAIVRVLQRGAFMTRQELKAVLQTAGIQTDVQRLAHIVGDAELDGVICSGPMRGKQFTYALLEQRAPNAKKLDRDEALSKLAYKYFSSHGPAQLKDFSWWSGLSSRDAQRGLDSVKSRLLNAAISGKTYWFIPHSGTSGKQPSTFLLSIYDEYIIAYKDRTDLSADGDIERMITWTNAMTSVIILKRKVAGIWKKKMNRNKLEVAVHPFRALNTTEVHSLESQVTKYAKFLGVDALCSILKPARLE